MSRKVSVAIYRAEPEAAGPVTLPALVRTLSSLQKVLLQVGEMLAMEEAPSEEVGPSSGRMDRDLHDACDLRVVGLEAGSALATLEVPEPTPNLFHEDLGLRALGTMRELARELSNGADWGSVHRILPHDDYRDLILRSYKDMCPTASEHSYVILSDPAVPTERFRLEASTRTRVQMLAAQLGPDDVVEERQLIGKVNLIQDEPPRCILLMPDGRHYRLPDGGELTSALWPLWRQRVSLRAICRVVRRREDDDYIAEIKDVSSFERIDDAPFSVASFPVPGGCAEMRQQLVVDPEFSDNMVAFTYPPLGIVAYGPTREEAEMAFRDELSWLWEAYVMADECKLAADARAVRAHLASLAHRGDA